MEIDFIKILETISLQSAKLARLEAQIQHMESSKEPTRSTDLKDLFTALAKAQAEMPIAALNKGNPYFKSRYADLASIVSASRPALTKYTLCVTQDIIYNEHGQSILYTRLGHSSGQFLESRMVINPPKNDIQTISSYTTYLKRMAYASLVGVVTGDEDDDGEVAMVNTREMIAKGPSTINKYNPKDESPETITKEQLEELEYELEAVPDLAEEVMDKLRLQSLADMPKSKYMVSLQRIREIKSSRNR